MASLYRRVTLANGQQIGTADVHENGAMTIVLTAFPINGEIYVVSDAEMYCQECRCHLSALVGGLENHLPSCPNFPL